MNIIKLDSPQALDLWFESDPGKFYGERRLYVLEEQERENSAMLKNRMNGYGEPLACDVAFRLNESMGLDGFDDIGSFDDFDINDYLFNN